MSHRTPKNPSPSQYQFSRNPSVNIPRTSIMRPFTHKTTISAGYLYPLYVDEVLPGDTFNVNCSIVARLATPLVPFMDNLYMDAQFFFVPWRLVWTNFPKMLGEQDNPGDSIDYTFPILDSPSGGVPVGSLSDYFGLPTGVEWQYGDVHSLFHRSYAKIWNEWYRDENLQQSIQIQTGDDPDQVSFYPLMKRGKRKDYFTSCLPAPQKGNAVTFSLGATAPVKGDGTALGLTPFTSGASGRGLVYYGGSAGALSASVSSYGKVVGTSASQTTNPTGSTVYAAGVTTDGSKSGLVADLASASSFSINELRQAFQIQKMLELHARGGTRYTELLYSTFGVSNPDSRLQRPELLGTFTIPVELHSVPQTSGSEVDGAQKSPQGNLAAFGIATGIHHAFDKSFTEFGCVMGLFSIRADLSYQQGIPRMYSRRGLYDIYQPVFAHLGEQAVLNKEIYCQGTSEDDAAFGYQERWSEYKYSINRITGQLRSTYAQSLDCWHLAQKFDSLPTLSSSFIQENPPIERVVAVTDAPQFIVDSYFQCNCVRPLPMFCIPGLIDHF